MGFLYKVELIRLIQLGYTEQREASMEKVWLKNYQSGVPTEINPDKYTSINEMFDEVCKLYADCPAFTNMVIQT